MKYIHIKKAAVQFLVLIFLSILSACTDNPQAPDSSKKPLNENDILIINEGLWGGDNATITHYDRSDHTVEHSYFQSQNPGLRLGDTANSMTVAGNLIYVVMNGSNTIEIIDLPTFTSQGRIALPNNPSPRTMAVMDDSIGFVTSLYNDEIIHINLGAKKILGTIPVGPAPEGALIFNDLLFVTNSGLGDIRGAEKDAGTLSIINPKNSTEISRIPVIFNCNSIQEGPDGLIYIGGGGSYASEKVSGIVVFDPLQKAVLDTIQIANHPRDFAFNGTDKGYVLTDDGVVQFSLQTRAVENVDFISTTKIDAAAYLYAIAVDAEQQEIFVSNARNFSTNGEVVCFDFNGVEKYRFSTRLLPGEIIIF
ncbi:MAG: hypothetical protein DWQ05_09095 [Calditrichaeota bacterium]|nr:MAG: hypothetical protein DWQ05_09095 [Calditrichota bacterium]